MVAEGVFAPGHLGELTQIAPFEMIDAILTACRAVQERTRKLPARVVVYLLLAAGLFEECGYPAVWRKLTGALSSLPIPQVTATALWHARCRLGVRPMRALFDLLRGPGSAIRTAGARWAGLLVVAIDGTHLDVADDDAVRAKLGKGSTQYTDASGYPQVLLVALVACGTRAVIDAVFGPGKPGESILGRRLMRSLHPGVIVLLDRGFANKGFLNAVHTTQAHFLARCPDGSFLSRIAGIEVRIVTCEITIATSQGRLTGVYRLATTLLDPRTHPASELVTLYHERWEVESAFFELKKSMLGRRVLRARSWPGIAQEIYALLSTYQLIRIAISDAAHATGTDPDRCGFTTALNTARAQVIQAANVIADTTIDLVGTIGTAVLDTLLPTRRLRLSPRAVKRPLSRYAYKSMKADRRTYQATIDIEILTGPISP
ncbi:transposase domain-containing protein [Streptomyces sp. NPDC127039]|uniref:transposase domain-containing protein n=1 Tax=Streptomyces sp. NPDC127039 TaxID=3347115 RepID=UPI003653AAAB